MNYMKELAIGNKTRYFLFGDVTNGLLRNAGCVYFNKNLMNDKFHKSGEDIYNMVFEGKWTFDLYNTYVEEAYTDVNGNGQRDDADLYGALGCTAKSVEHYQYPAMITTTSWDKDNMPVLTLNNERTVSFVEKLYKLYVENPGFKIVPAAKAVDKSARRAVRHGVHGKIPAAQVRFYIVNKLHFFGVAEIAVALFGAEGGHLAGKTFGYDRDRAVLYAGIGGFFKKRLYLFGAGACGNIIVAGRYAAQKIAHAAAYRVGLEPRGFQPVAYKLYVKGQI